VAAFMQFHSGNTFTDHSMVSALDAKKAGDAVAPPADYAITLPRRRNGFKRHQRL